MFINPDDSLRQSGNLVTEILLIFLTKSFSVLQGQGLTKVCKDNIQKANLSIIFQ